MNLTAIRKTMTTDAYNKLSDEKKKLMDDLIALQQKYKGKCVIATLCQLGRKGKTYSLAMKEIIRKNVLVEIDELVKYNWHWDQTGRYYDLHVEETEIRWEEQEQWKERMKEKAELEEETGKAFNDAVKNISNASKKAIDKSKRSLQ